MATINLSQLGFTLTKSSTNFLTEFVVMNTNNSPLNGGCCCLWTAPAGTTFVTFEMWGGGGGGAGGCCCQQGFGGGSGAYTMKSVKAATSGGLAGCQYTICAAGSTSCAATCLGCGGFTSYVTGFGLSNFCAAGGCYGTTGCFSGCGTYNSWTECIGVCAFGGDINIYGMTGSFINSVFCFGYSTSYSAVAPATVSGPMVSAGGCQPAVGNLAVVPGGGGGTTTTFGGGCCWGLWGAQGMVSVTYG